MFMNDVNKKDEIRQLAIEDLRSFGIKCRPKKEKKASIEATKRNRRLFKTDLYLLPKQTVTLPTGQQLIVPKLVHDLCSFILTRVETEGLFRKGGSKARQNELRLLLDAGCLLEETHHVIDVANVLKTFLRELPEPLFPYAYHESFLRCTLLSENYLKSLLLTCLLLPSEHLNTLTYFLQFLNEVTKYSSFNKMDSYNLAVVIAPTVFPMLDQLQTTTHRLAKICDLVKLLIDNACSIGLISENIIDRIAPFSTSGNSLSEDENKMKIRRKKKRRSGSLTRMFNGLRKIVGGKSTEELSPTVSATPDLLKTPNLSKSSRKRKLDTVGLSNKQKLEVLQSLPQGTALSTPISINPNPIRSSPCKSFLQNDNNMDKEKKSQWGLGTRRLKYTKPAISESNFSTFTGTRAALERRWSAVSQTNVFKRKRTRNSCGESLTSTEIKSLPESQQICDVVLEQTPDYIKIPVSEYEDIKNRVTALERQICVEFEQFDNVNSQAENSFETEKPQSLVQVQTAYEKTLTNAEYLSPTTDLLARRLSKELKIRRSSEQKVVRSPSARKIGTLRRRSKELEKHNANVQRTQSWHVQSRSNVPKVYTKRGKPVASFRSQTPLKVNSSSENDNYSFELLPSKTTRSNSLPNEATPPVKTNKDYLNRALQSSDKWKSAEGFFYKMKTPDNSCSVRSSIARLRSQNAGMVLAKAKLFDGLLDSDTSANSSSSLPQIKTGNKIGAIRNSNRIKSFKCDDKHCVRHSISPKKKYVKSPNYSSSFKLTFAEKENHVQFEGNHRDFSDIVEKGALKDCNPNYAGDHTGMPKIKRSLTLKSPKRICSTPIYQDQRTTTPLKVLPIKRVY